jgi:hypothetical protein
MFLNLIKQFGQLHTVYKCILVVFVISLIASPAYCAGKSTCEHGDVEVSRELINEIAATCAETCEHNNLHVGAICLNEDQVKKAVGEAIDEKGCLCPLPEPQEPCKRHGSDCEGDCQHGTIKLVPEPVGHARHHIVPGVSVAGDKGYSLGYRYQPRYKEWSLMVNYVSLTNDDIAQKYHHINHIHWYYLDPEHTKRVRGERESEALLISFDLPVSMIGGWFK